MFQWKARPYQPPFEYGEHSPLLLERPRCSPRSVGHSWGCQYGKSFEYAFVAHRALTALIAYARHAGSWLLAARCRVPSSSRM